MKINKYRKNIYKINRTFPSVLTLFASFFVNFLHLYRKRKSPLPVTSDVTTHNEQATRGLSF